MTYSIAWVKSGTQELGLRLRGVFTSRTASLAIGKKTFDSRAQPLQTGVPQEVSHFVLTRFNVRNFYHKSEPTDEWLRERVSLFVKFCLPSMAAQDNQHFRWLVLCDSKSPDWFLRKMAKIGEGVFETVLVEGTFDASVASAIVGQRCESRFVITTRLDNDDAVAMDFVNEVQNSYVRQRHEFINLVNGAQFSEGRLYLRPYTQNPFCSLVEEIGDEGPETVFSTHHYRISESGPVKNVATGHPMWLQVIHDGNVLNEIVGLRTAATKVTPHFACTLQTKDSFMGVTADRIMGGLRILWRLARKPARVLELVRVLTAPRSDTEDKSQPS